MSLLLVLLAFSEPTSIPLDTVWGYNIRDTKEIQALEPDGKGRISQVFGLLVERPKEGHKAGSAIVVEGEGKKALNNAYIALRNRNEYSIPPSQLMREGVELSLLFFVYMGGRWVEIDSVEIAQGEKSVTHVTVYYHFITHQLAESKVHFALIPLGKLPAGAVRVKIQQLPPVDSIKGTEGKIKDETRLVSDSFTFGINPKKGK